MYERPLQHEQCVRAIHCFFVVVGGRNWRYAPLSTRFASRYNKKCFTASIEMLHRQGNKISHEKSVSFGLRPDNLVRLLFFFFFFFPT